MVASWDNTHQLKPATSLGVMCTQSRGGGGGVKNERDENAEVEMMCSHQSISVHLATLMHLFGRRDQPTCKHDPYDCTWFESANFFFLLSLCMSSSKFLFPPNTHIHTTNMDLNLAWRTHFHALEIYFGNGRGHDLTYFVNVQSKSKAL